jgi:hypothetical protein
MLMGKAARLRSDEYERVRMEGYEMHLRALALRSHAWVCLSAKAYQGALETVKESIRLLAASKTLFPLQRDSTWAEGHLQLMIVQRDLIRAAMILATQLNCRSRGKVIANLLSALRALQESQRCFSFQAMKLRLLKGSEHIKEVLMLIGRENRSDAAFRRIKQIIVDDSVF